MTNIISRDLNIPNSQTTAPQLIVSAENPPKSLVKLPSGAIFEAQLISTLSDGRARLDSIFGQLIIKTGLTLPENSSLELQILRFKPNPQLLLRRINNFEIKDPSAAKSIKQAIKPISQSNLKSRYEKTLDSKPFELDINAQIKGTLLRPSKKKSTKFLTHSFTNKYSNLKNLSNSAEPKYQAQKEQIDPKSDKQTHPQIKEDLISKTVLKTFLGLKELRNKAISLRELTTKNSGSGFLETIQSLMRNTKIIKSSINLPLKAGTKLVLKFVEDKTHAAADPKITTFNANLMQCVVVATTPGGQAIVDTPIGIIAVESKVRLKTGFTLQLEILPDKISEPTFNSPVMRFEANFQSKEWVNLNEAIHEIGQTSPQLSKHITDTLLPQPNTQLTSNILFYLKALKGADIRLWIGRNVASLLGKVKPDLLAQLDEDFTILSRAHSEPQLNEWRTAIIPFLATNGLEQFKLHTQNQTNQEKDENSSRFLIDISLSRLGRLQMDGLLKKKSKRLDLIIRTQQILPRKMRIEITKIYKDFSELSKIAGQISFQVNRHLVEVPIPQLADYGTTEVII